MKVTDERRGNGTKRVSALKRGDTFVFDLNSDEVWIHAFDGECIVSLLDGDYMHWYQPYGEDGVDVNEVHVFPVECELKITQNII
jgi:hypothetical protein